MVADPLLVAPRRPFWRALGLFAVAFAVGFVASTVAVLIEMIAGVRSSALRNATGAPLQGALIAFELSMAALVLWRLPAMTGLNLRELGLRRPRGRDWRVFGYGVLGLVGVRVVIAVQLALLHQSEHRQAGFETIHLGSPLDVVLTLAALVVVAPFAEELVFRMTLFRTLAQRLPVWLAVAISACVFAGFHMDALLFVGLALFGAVLALCYRASGCIVVSMLLHACNNALGALGIIYLAR
ncbi:MAG TPA: type II CAAX endopeptidase family protein [Candidatus Baltobacteraceae bacterium]|nr:type II CAAX endopeptidase family protein [Candidatus Baltobacteraceae bacterium]